MNHRSLSRCLATLAASLLLLSACGGGGGGGGENDDVGVFPARIPPTTPLGNSFQYEGICTLEGQRNFVRSYLDEVYLWYNEIPPVEPTAYDNIPDYFDALLVRTPDAAGQPKDRFSAVLPLSQARDVRQSLGLEQSSAGSVLKNHTSYVPLAQVVTSDTGRRVGYILFNDHDVGAQDDLIAAVRTLQQGAGVQDLVLDLRNNSGGYLYIALTAASMITGPQGNGQVFEQLRYNDKRADETAAATLRFSNRVQFGESQNPVGTVLPQLGLARVFVLTTPRTCSASESIINSLRGINVQVYLIGSTT
ncbi:MAG TPA: S41 family peptidase, partial [Ramlibacter sp.]|nr:S41 family peptidase [Ramlibacter sp.]